MQTYTVYTKKGLFTTSNFKLALKVFQEDFEARKRELLNFQKALKEMEREMNKKHLKKKTKKTEDLKKLKEEKMKELINGYFKANKLKRITEEWIEATGTKVGARAIIEKAFIDKVYEITGRFDEEMFKRGDVRREAIKTIKAMIKAYNEWEEFYKSL